MRGKAAAEVGEEIDSVVSKNGAAKQVNENVREYEKHEKNSSLCRKRDKDRLKGVHESFTIDKDASYGDRRSVAAKRSFVPFTTLSQISVFLNDLLFVKII